MVVGDHAHSEILNLGVELGVLGMALSCAFAGLLLCGAAHGSDVREDSRWHRAVIAGTSGMLIQSFFSPCLRAWDVAPFFWTQLVWERFMKENGLV